MRHAIAMNLSNYFSDAPNAGVAGQAQYGTAAPAPGRQEKRPSRRAANWLLEFGVYALRVPSAEREERRTAMEVPIMAIGSSNQSSNLGRNKLMHGTLIARQIILDL
ncbi:unnamed protein product [Spodoptera exigua]|nr:unnamed protein product [Spodoptera exigua]